MGKAKISMELIKKEKLQKDTFRKRLNSLKKKSLELSTLCDIKVCMIVFGPNDDLQICPNNCYEIKDMINKYKHQSQDDRKKRTLGLSNFFEDRKKNASKMFVKMRERNDEAAKTRLECPTWDSKYNELSEESVRDFGVLLESKLQAAKGRFDFLSGCDKKLEATVMDMVECSEYDDSYLMESLFIHPTMIPLHDPFYPLTMNSMENPAMAMMLMTGSEYCHQLGGASSSDFVYARPLDGPAYYDPLWDGGEYDVKF